MYGETRVFSSLTLVAGLEPRQIEASREALTNSYRLVVVRTKP